MEHCCKKTFVSGKSGAQPEKETKLASKINAALQRIISGQKILDLGEIGIEDDDIEVVQPAVP